MKTILKGLSRALFAGLLLAPVAQGADTVTLLAKDAKLKGDLKYNLQYKNIGAWESLDGAASWDLKDISPGLYNVRIVYAVKSDTAGRSFRMSTGAESKVVSIVQGTPGWFDFIPMDAGTLKISSQRTTFVIAAKEIPRGEALMNLAEVQLEKVPLGGNPVAAAPGVPTAPMGPKTTLPPTVPAPPATPVATVVNPSPADVEVAPLGEWIWMDKTVLIIEPEGKASRVEKSGNQLIGKWSWNDKETRTWHIDWNNGVTVTFTMSPDLNVMTGMNTLGGKVKTVRSTAVEEVAAKEAAAKEAEAAAKRAAAATNKPPTTKPVGTKPPTTPTPGAKPPGDFFGTD